MPATDATDLRDRLTDLVHRYDVPGASVSVLADGQVVDATAGVVNTRTGVEVRPDSPFMIQSITKVWTATLLLQLVEEGLVGLDDPVVRHLPGFRTADPERSATITIRHLLTHTGGFEGDIWAATTAGDDALERFVGDHVSRAAQHADPGELYSYCSAGMAVLGRLVEVYRGTTYAGALRRHLADPLGLDGVAFDAGEALGFRTAIGHVRPRPGEPLRPLRTWAVMPSSNPAAGNQLAMPARGLIELARMHLADGLAPGGDRLLAAESARLIREPQIEIPATAGRTRQGLGWRLGPQRRVVEHGGGALGCGAMLRLVPDHGVAIAVLANGGDTSGLIGELCDEMLRELAGIEPSAPLEAPDPVAVTNPDRYVGRYELRNVVAEVSADESGCLWLTETERNDAARMVALAGVEAGPETTELRRTHDGTFVRVEEGRAAGVVEFVDTGDDGRARYLHTGRAAPRTD